MKPFQPLKPAFRRGWMPLAAVAAAALFAGCVAKKDEGSGPIAARVDKAEITQGQVNFVLQQRSLTPDQAAAAGPQILERLIDQQLATQKAEEQKLDRDPRVVRVIEAARREVLARAYLEKVGEAAVKPTAEDVKKYYDERPELFRERRVYNIQEIAIEARPEQAKELRDKLAASRDVAAFLEYLKTTGLRFGGNQAVRAAEQLPLASLSAMAKLKDGQALAQASPTGLQVVVLAGSRLQPVSEEQARPAIEQFLLNERRRKLTEDDMKALRAAAKIEYVGKPAAGAAQASAPGAASAASAR